MFTRIYKFVPDLPTCLLLGFGTLFKKSDIFVKLFLGLEKIKGRAPFETKTHLFGDLSFLYYL